MSILDYFKQKNILRNQLLMTVIWITCAFSYYMLSIQIKHFPGDFSINTIIVGAAEIPAPLVAGLLMNTRLSINSIFIVYFLLQTCSGAGVIFFIDPKNTGWIFPTLIGISRFCLTGAFTAVWVAHPQMFPTLFAVTSLGLSNLVARATVIFAPLVAEIKYPIPMFIYTIMTLLAAISAIFIVERSKLD